MRSTSVLAILSCLVVSASIARSQVTTGTINVEVQDSSGGVVAGAAIRLLHVSSGQERSGASSATGVFRGAFMPVGEYSIRVEAPGFRTKTLAGIILQVDQNATIPVTLDVGAVQEIVEVTAADASAGVEYFIHRPGDRQQTNR